MIVRLLVLAALASLACRMIFGKWPWDYLAPRRTREQALFRARKLLGVSANANARQVREAHRRLSTGRHPDRGGSHASQQELNAARDLLLADLPEAIPEPPHEP